MPDETFDPSDFTETQFDPSEFTDAPPDPSEFMSEGAVAARESKTTSTAVGLVNALRRGITQVQNIPAVVLASSVSDAAGRPSVRYRADRLSRDRLSQALLDAGQEPEAQQEAYFKSGPEALIAENQKSIIKPVIERSIAAEALPKSEAQKNMAKAEGASGKFKAWASDPIELTASIILESLPASVTGAAVGTLAGPAGMAAGAGLASGITTFSSELFANAAARNIDIQDPDAVTKWLGSKEFDEDFKAARTKASIIGVIDAATAGKAGSFIEPAIKAGLKKAAVASAKEVAMQAAGGAGGEALGSLAAGKPIDPFDVFAEAIAEVGSAPGEVLGNLRRAGRVQRTTPAESYFAAAPTADHALNKKQRARLKELRESPEFKPGGPLEKVGGMMATFGGDTVVHVIASPDNPSVGFVTGLRGKGLASKATEIEAALRKAGFIEIDYRPDNEDGRAAARVRLFESVKKRFQPAAAPVVEEQPVAPAKTAVASQTAAAEMTPEAIQAELDSLTQQIAALPKAKTIAELDARAPMMQRASFLREALGIQEAAKPVQEEVIPVAKETKPKGKKVSTPTARVLDTSGTAAKGSAFDDRIGSISEVPDETTDTVFTERVLDGRGEGKQKSDSKRTIVVLDNETGKLVELSVWENDGAKVATKKGGTDLLGFLRTYMKQDRSVPIEQRVNRLRYTPVASLRYAEVQSAVNRPVTLEELAKLKADNSAAVGPVQAGKTAITAVNEEGEVEREVIDPAVVPKYHTVAEFIRDRVGLLGRLTKKQAMSTALDVLRSEDGPDAFKAVIAEFHEETDSEAFRDLPRGKQVSRLEELFAGRIYDESNTNEGGVREQPGTAVSDQAAGSAVVGGEPAAATASQSPVSPAAPNEQPAGVGQQAQVPAVADRPPAANLGDGLADGEGMTPEAVAQAIAIEDSAGVEVQIISKDEAERITGYKETRGYAGFAWQGKAYLVAENISSDANAQAVLREEVAHVLLQTEAGSKLMASLVESGRLNLTPQERAALESQGYLPEQVLEEFIAKSARENRTWWQKAVASIRALLSKLGLQLSNQETAQMLLTQIRSARDPNAPIGTVAQAAPSPSGTEKSFEDQANNEDPPLPDDEFVPVSFHGVDHFVRARDRITPETIGESISTALEAFTAAGFPVEQRTFTDTDGQRKTIFILQKTENADRKGRTLLTAVGNLMRNQGRDRYADRLGMLIQSIRQNFFIEDSAMADMSESTRLGLFGIADEEASFRGRALRALRNFKADIINTSRSVDVMLNRIYAEAFGGPQILAVMDRVSAAVRSRFTDAEVNSIVAKLTDENEQAQLAAAIRRALAGDFSSSSDVVNATRTALIEGGMTEEQADATVGTVGPQIESSVKRVGQSVAKSVLGSLTPAEKAAVGGKNWRTVEELIAKGVFDDVEALKKLAAKRGWRVPNSERIAEMKRLADEIQKLTELTPAEEAAAGGDPAKIAALKAAKEGTFQERGFKKQKKLATMWSEMTLPTSLFKFWKDDVRSNNARFINELISANLLAKPSFFSKQVIDILFQWGWRMPIRAMAQAQERYVVHKNKIASLLSAIAQQELANGKPEDIAALRAQLATVQSQPVDFWKEAALSMRKMYGDNIRNLIPALVKTRAAFAGRIETRNVDRLMSSIGALDRLWQRGNSLWEQKDYFGGAIHYMIAAVGISYRIAGSLDFVHGLPAEMNDRRHRVILGLRNQGFTRSEAEVQADIVFNTNKAETAEALAMARSLAETEDKPFSENELKEAAYNIIERRQFQKINELGLDGASIRELAASYRNVLGWNERENRGPGGLIGGAVAGTGRLLENAGLPLPLGRFGNAIAIGINRNLQKTVFYALTNKPWLGSKDSGESSPWFKTQTDIYERRLEAAAGTLVGSVMLGVAFAGLAKVWLKPPIDKEERDLWDREGHKAGTVEFPLGDGKVSVWSLTTGPLALFAPYLAAGGALNDLAVKQEKTQAKLNAEAARRGLAPGKAPGVTPWDWLGVAWAAAQGSALGTRTSSGLFYSVTDYGIPNAKKFVASQLSPVLPGLPAMQEVSRMAGVVIDPKKADLWDFIVPLATSSARKVNMMGDPVGTESDVQRVFQTLSGGSYPVIDTNKAKDSAAYAALWSSGYRPPSINPAQGYQIGGEFRPLNDTELSRYTELRGQYLKQNLGEIGPAADESQARAAYNDANKQALSEVGVIVASTGRGGGDAGQASGASGPRASTARGSGPVIMGGAPRRTTSSRLGIGGSRIRVTAGSLRPTGSRLRSTGLPRIAAPRTTRVLTPRARTRQARRNRLRR